MNNRYARETPVCSFLTAEGVDTKTLEAILMKADGAEMVAETDKGYCLHQNREILTNLCMVSLKMAKNDEEKIFKQKYSIIYLT